MAYSLARPRRIWELKSKYRNTKWLAASEPFAFLCPNVIFCQFLRYTIQRSNNKKS